MEREPVRPVDPKDIVEKKTMSFPDEVLESFNELIVEKFNGHSSHVLQKEVVALILRKAEEKGKIISKDQIYDKHWLDVEETYREAGWKVKYDKPVYYGGENFEAYFEFSRGQRRRSY